MDNYQMIEVFVKMLPEPRSCGAFALEAKLKADLLNDTHKEDCTKLEDYPVCGVCCWSKPGTYERAFMIQLIDAVCNAWAMFEEKSKIETFLKSCF